MNATVTFKNGILTIKDDDVKAGKEYEYELIED